QGIHAIQIIVLISFVVNICTATDKDISVTSSCDGKQYKYTNLPKGCKAVSILAVTVDDNVLQKELSKSN
ncbi:hypothetical protein Bpfe_019240, partial [Biomphalaria pfeifferi]